LWTLRPAADWAAFKLTVCGESTPKILKFAISFAPGGEEGSGVVAFWSVDQELTKFQPIPVPSQNTKAACASGSGTRIAATSDAAIRTKVRQLGRRCMAQLLQTSCSRIN